MDISSLTAISLIELLFEIIVFLFLVGLGILIVKKIPKFSHRFFNPKEYLPEDEIHTLKQVYYLSLMAACFICALATFIFQEHDLMYFAVFDILLSLFIAVTADKSTWPRKLFLLLLVPYGSLTFLLFDLSLVGFLDLIHIPVLLYYVKYYYDKFKEYTEANGLGITIILLFTIVFISSIITIFVESKNPLDAFVMVSNAFTSNGYSVLGDSIPGKINSLILVWSGFIISGVGTATLSVALLSKYYNNKFDELNKKLEDLEDLIKDNEEKS